AGSMFAPLNEETPKDPTPKQALDWVTQKLVSALIRYRMSSEGFHRKVGVLMQSLHDDPHFYFIGYLTVKNIWLNAAPTTEAFMDRDQFLSFLHDWIFQDWVLIDYVLDESLGTEAAAYLISERVQQRLTKLATADLAM